MYLAYALILQPFVINGNISIYQNILEWDDNNRQTNKENYKWLYINTNILKSFIDMHVELEGR